MKSNKGFSLVELIVVIAIMAIIAGVAVPVYSGYITKANEGTDDNTVGTATHAAQIIVADKDYLDVSFSFAGANKALVITATSTTDGAAAEALAELATVLGAEVAEDKITITLKSTKEYSETVAGVNVA